MFENFPYTDMHQLNLDWIIKIAKDFLDQYTTIQQIITDGIESLGDKTDEGLTSLQTRTTESLEALTAKKVEIETLLNAWYETHSEDIANQLTAAIAAFNVNAAVKAQEAIDSIPADYTTLALEVTRLIDTDKTNIITTYYQGGFIGAADGQPISSYQLTSVSNRIRNIQSNTGLEEAFKIPGGGRIKITPMPGYKYAVQILDATTHVGVIAFESRITTFEYTRSGDYYVALWVGKTDDGTITPAEGVNVKVEYLTNEKKDINDLFLRVKYLKDQMKNTAFENGFRWGNDFSLPFPPSFTNYPFYVYLSKAGTCYGYRYDRVMMRINQTTNYKTYYVAPDGDDIHSGVSPLSPFKTLDHALEQSDIGTLILAEGVYIKAQHWGDITIDRPINIIGNGTVIIDGKTAGSAPIKFTNNCYIENICFYRGSSNVYCQFTAGVQAIFNRCIFMDSLYDMALKAEGGNYVMLNCCVVGAARDGFNYHANGNVPVKVLEIECFGYNCGLASSEITHNASTIHDEGSRIIRIGCEYHTTKGTVIADADGAISINIACAAFSTRPTTDNRSGNYGAFSGAIVYLYDCDSSGSLHDIICDGSIMYTTQTYPKEHVINNGTVNRLT